jgi:hypothetical protein
MFAFIQACSGQSGSGFVPHSPAPLALAPPPAAEALAAAVALPASVAPPGAALGPASFAFDVVPLPLGAVFVAAAGSVDAAVALAAGALDAAGGRREPLSFRDSLDLDGDGVD